MRIEIPNYKNAYFSSNADYPNHIVDASKVISLSMKIIDRAWNLSFADKLEIINDRNRDSPINLYHDNIIYLNFSSNLLYSQIAYQIGHEYCHRLINRNEDQPYLWFEEIICQCSSRYTLKKLSQMKLKGNFKNYELNYLRYYNDLFDSKNVKSFSLKNLLDQNNKYPSELLSEIILECDSNHRPLHQYAASFLTPIFNNDFSLWTLVPEFKYFDIANTLRENLMELYYKTNHKGIIKIIETFEEN